MRFFLRKWPVLAVSTVIGVMAGYVVAVVSKPTYTGQLTFVLSSENKPTGLSGVASQLGVDFGSSGTNNAFAGDNILTLFKSERMIKAALLKKPESQDEILANLLMKEYKLDESWAKSERLKKLLPFPADAAAITPVQDSLLRELHGMIVKKCLSVSRLDKKLSVFQVSTTSTNEVISCFLTRFLMDETANFYIETKTYLARQNLQMLQREADSIRRVLGGSIVSTASHVDRTYNLNPALQINRAPIQREQVNSTVMSAAYGEIIKNLELAKINLQKETPLYQVIDTPQLPLKRVKAGKIKLMLLGALACFFITALYLVIKRSYTKYST